MEDIPTILLVIASVSIIINIAAAHHKNGAAMLALPLQIAVLWSGYDWNGAIGLIAAFIVVNVISIILCQTVFRNSIRRIQGR